VVGTGQTYVAAPLAPVDLSLRGDRTLPEVVEDPLQSRRYFDDDRTVLVQIEIAECINDVRVWVVMSVLAFRRSLNIGRTMYPFPKIFSEPYNFQFSDNEIRSVQAALRRLGIYSGQADGILGPDTRRAIEDYQVKNKLPVTGQPDKGLNAMLGR
jgi:Putative peptidoglycan binding domain